MTYLRLVPPVLFAALLAGTAAKAQTDPKPTAAPDAPATAAPDAPAAKPAGAPAPLVVLFEPGSSSLRAEDKAVLDRASRAYNEGKPIVMILTGSSDRVGNPQKNLTLSQRRATAVLKGLLSRGIPAERFQVLAKGETEPVVPTSQGVAESRNRSVEISWH